MALPREHHNVLTTHFLLTIIINWTTLYLSTTPKWRCHHSKTSQHMYYFKNNNKQRGSRVSFKNQFFDVFVTDNFRMLCAYNGLVDAVTSQWWPSWVHFTRSGNAIVAKCLWQPHQHLQGRRRVRYLRWTFRSFHQRNNQQWFVEQLLIAHSNAHGLVCTMRSLKRTLN